ncbi:MAG TPA: hypothetical protein VNM24_07455 [Burkholderiales bacterium]|jgi:hypothetical protein|nr:hypothetical protein [Burkholderiales bacterium]
MRGSVKFLLAALALAGSAASGEERVRGMAFDVYIRLEIGMSEAELLQRAGPPDYESTDGLDTRSHAIVQDSVLIDPVSGRRIPQRHVLRGELSQTVKTWYYLPTVADPFTTTVRLTGGRISQIERKKKF